MIKPPHDLTITAISLHQPWASLIAVQAKRIETRSWQPPKNLIGQTIAIHAAKRLVKPEPSDQVFNQALITALGTNWITSIPAGTIVAIATLTSAKQVQNPSDIPHGDESLFGDYKLGRWMWMLDDIKPLETPIPAAGHQKFWKWSLPTELNHIIDNLPAQLRLY